MTLTGPLQPSYGDRPGSPAFLLRTLGGLTIESLAGGLVDLSGQRKALALLALLAVAGTTALSRDKIAAYLWPESDAEQARNALSQLLFRVRRELGAGAITGAGTLTLDPAVVASDIARFDQALAAGHLEEAVAAYSGPFLDGFFLRDAPEFERWVSDERRRAEQAYLRALERLAESATDRGRLAAAAEWWGRRVTAEPLGARAARAYLEALIAAGDREAALRFGAAYTALVRAELEALPDPGIIRLIDQLRTEATSPAASAKPAPSPVTDPVTPSDPGPSPGRRSRATVIAAIVVLAGSATVLLNRGEGGDYRIGRATQLTFESGLEIDPDLSPDGRFVAYTAGSLSHMRIYLRQESGRAAPVVADSGRPQRRPLWSPDGTHLLFLYGREVQELAIVPALGGVPRVIVHGQVNSADWAPDGRRVAYVRRDTLYVQSLEGGPARFIATYHDPFGVRWSPDGRWIAFAAGNSKFGLCDLTCFGASGPSQIMVVSAEGGTPIAVSDRASLNVSPQWGPDSRRLLFVSNRDGPRDVYLVRLASSGAPAGPVTRLTVGLSAHSITLSDDGRRLAYSAFVQRSNVWALPITPARPRAQADAIPVTSGTQFVEDLAVSHDGRRLYFDSDRGGNADIWRMELPAGTPVRVTRDSAGEYYPTESPDGRWIAFHSMRSGFQAILVAPAAGGPAERVTSNLQDELWPRWSPDGRSLAFATEYPVDSRGLAGMYVVSRDAAGRWGRPRKLWSDPNEPAWAPDGRSLLIADGLGSVWSIAADGGQPRRLYTPRQGSDDPVAEGPQWLPDGTAIVMKSHDREDLTSFWIVPAAGGRARRLARLEDPERQSPRDELVTDGKKLYFTIHDRQSDIFVVETDGLD